MKAHWLLTDRAARWLMLVAVAMVVLWSMLPQSENAVFVVMMVERFWL